MAPHRFVGEIVYRFSFLRLKKSLYAANRAVKPFIDSGRCIYAFWHSQILFLSYFHKNQGVSILVSNSEDGEIIAQVLQRQGAYHNSWINGKRRLARIDKTNSGYQNPPMLRCGCSGWPPGPTTEGTTRCPYFWPRKQAALSYRSATAPNGGLFSTAGIVLSCRFRQRHAY